MINFIGTHNDEDIVNSEHVSGKTLMVVCVASSNIRLVKHNVG